MSDKLRKIIREFIESELSSSNVSNEQIQEDLVFLKDFSIKNEESTDSEKKITFYHNIEDNETIVIITKDSNGWSIDYDIVGFLRDQNADFHLGPFESYGEFVKQANDHINNNLLLTTKNSDDNVDRANEKFIEDMVKEMLSRKEDIMNLPEGQMEDLKKLCQLFDKALKHKRMEEIMPLLYSKNKNLTGIHNILNKVHGMDFYNSFNKGNMHKIEK